MREIVFDTETTGLDPETGDRIVEIGAVELVNHLPSGRSFHTYVNPQRSMPPGAFEIHGLSEEFLRDKPVFGAIARDFLDFVGEDSRLVAHNAAFDMKFIAWELRLCGLPPPAPDRAIDTAEMARRRYPGSPATLDALCRRFGVDNSARDKHGALLDAELLAEVYLELIGGRQPGLVLAAAPSGRSSADGTPWTPRPRTTALPSRLTTAEAEAHAAAISRLGPGALWRGPA